MYRKTEDFLTEWKHESASTIKLFKNITSGSLNQKVTEDGRSIGFLAWHIVTSAVEMLSRAGLVLEGPAPHSPAPEKIEEIIKQYEIVSESISEVVAEKWFDERLTDKIEMYGSVWAKGETLSILIKHQTHHRGQITVLMRQAGLVVPGIYGPAKEEWAAWGMPTMQ